MTLYWKVEMNAHTNAQMHTHTYIHTHTHTHAHTLVQTELTIRHKSSYKKDTIPHTQGL